MLSLSIVVGRKVSVFFVSHRLLGDKSKSAEQIKEYADENPFFYLAEGHYIWQI